MVKPMECSLREAAAGRANRFLKSWSSLQISGFFLNRISLTILRENVVLKPVTRIFVEQTDQLLLCISFSLIQNRMRSFNCIKKNVWQAQANMHSLEAVWG